MRLLLDECTPRRLAAALAPHEVDHVSSRGWSGIKNGHLLSRMQEAGFAGLITTDRNLTRQQAVSNTPLFVVVVRAKSNRIADLRPLAPEILRAVSFAQPGQVYAVGA